MPTISILILALLLPTLLFSKPSHKKYSLLLEPGILNIDFNQRNGNQSFSGMYHLNHSETGIKSHLVSYDSRQNYLPPSVGPFTDQANRYLISLVNKRGNMVTVGAIHDKREERNQQNVYRYTKGGVEICLLVGKWKTLYKRISITARAGSFLSLNNISASLHDSSGLILNSYQNKRRYAGYGGAIMVGVGYCYPISKRMQIGFQTGETLLAGKTRTKVQTNMDSNSAILSTFYWNTSYNAGIVLQYSL